MAVALLVRLFHLDHQSLWVDEIFTWHNADIGGRLTWSDVFTNDHGPLLQVILHVLGGWLGDAAAVLRAPSVVAGVLTVPALAALAGRVLGPRAVLPAAWLAALSPFLLWYSQEARNYSLAILFATAAAWAAVRWRAEGGFRWGAIFVALAWLGLLSNLNVGLVLPVLLVWVALPHGGARGRLVPALAALAALGVLESPWIAEYVHRLALERLVPGREALPGEVPLRGDTTFSWGAYPFTLSVFSVGYTLGPTLRELHAAAPLRVALAYWPVLLPAALIFGFLSLAGVLALRRAPARLLFVLGLIVVPTLFVTYFAVQNFKVFNPRYVASGFPGFALLLIAGWIVLGPRLRAWSAAAVVALWALSIGNLYFDPEHGKEDFRGATAWLAERVEPEDRLVASGNYAPLDYYWRDREPAYRHLWLGHVRDPERLRRELDERSAPGRPTWVVVSRPFLDDPERRLERHLLEERGAQVERFPGVRVYRLPAPSR